MPTSQGQPAMDVDKAQDIDGFARALGLESDEIAFLHEYPLQVRKAIISNFDASGSKDGNVLGRLQGYARHIANRKSNVSKTATAPTATDCASRGGLNGSHSEQRYQRELLLHHRGKCQADAPGEPPQKMLSAMKLPTASTAPTSKVPPSLSKSLSSRPVALGDHVDVPVKAGGLNANAAEFVPLSPLKSPVSLTAMLAEPQPSEAPTLVRTKTAPAVHNDSSRDAAPVAKADVNPFEYHLHRLLFLVVAKRSQGETGDDSQGVLLSGLRLEWQEVFGNDISPLMEKCGYTEVQPLVAAIDGLRIVGEGDEARAVTTRSTFEAQPSEQRQPPTPHPPPPRALGPLPTAAVDPLGAAAWAGHSGAMSWGAMGAWGAPWQAPFGGMGYPMSPAAQVGSFPSQKLPEPPSSSAF